MRLMSWWATAPAVAIVVVALSAQEKPNFSGEWTITTSTNASINFCGQQCTITQDATSLTVTRTAQANQQKSTFKLDGSETKIAVPGARGRGEVVTKAMWDANTLRISFFTGPNIGLDAPTVVVSMNAGQMEVESSMPAQGSNGEVRSGKQTYKKN